MLPDSCSLLYDMQVDHAMKSVQTKEEVGGKGRLLTILNNVGKGYIILKSNALASKGSEQNSGRRFFLIELPLKVSKNLFG